MAAGQVKTEMQDEGPQSTTPAPEEPRNLKPSAEGGVTLALLSPNPASKAKSEGASSSMVSPSVSLCRKEEEKRVLFFFFFWVFLVVSCFALLALIKRGLGFLVKIFCCQVKGRKRKGTILKIRVKDSGSQVRHARIALHSRFCFALENACSVFQNCCTLC